METLWTRLIKADETLFFFLNNRLGEIPGLQYLLGWPTFLGDAYILLPLAALFLCIWDRERSGKAFLTVLVGCLIAAGLCYFLKDTIDRARPYSRFFFPFMNGQVNIHILFERYSSHSFPSGHAATVTAVVTGLNGIYRWKPWGLLFSIPWIGLTRIYVGAHFPADVLGGILVGFLGALLGTGVCKVLQRTRMRPESLFLH